MSSWSANPQPWHGLSSCFRLSSPGSMTTNNKSTAGSNRKMVLREECGHSNEQGKSSFIRISVQTPTVVEGLPPSQAANPSPALPRPVGAPSPGTALAQPIMKRCGPKVSESREVKS